MSSGLFSSSLVAALLLAAPATRAAAQACNPMTQYAPVNAELRSYTGDAEDTTEPRTQSIAHNCQQQYRLFLPPAASKPPTGWPVLVCTALGGYVGSGINRCIDKSTLQGRALEQGIAVIMVGMTLSTDTMACESGEVETIPGHGLFHPPGYLPPGLDFAPYGARDYAMPEKDAVMIVQHIRHNGGRPGLLADIDPGRIAVLGQSAGANSFMWAAFGPDRRDEEPFASLGGQFDAPTRPDLAILRGGFVWWPIFSPEVPANPPYLVLHYGSQGHAERAATTLADCDPFELQAGSPLWYEAVYPEPSLPVLMTYGEPAYCRDYTSDGPAGPYAYSFAGGGLEGLPNAREDDCDDEDSPDEQPGGMHPCWSGFAWKAQHPASCRLFLQTPETWHCYAAGTEAESPGGQSMDMLIVDWLAARFAELPSPWALFEQAAIDGQKRMIGVAGAQGVPRLTGAGSLRAGSTGARITLSGARPGASGRLHTWGSAEPRLEHAGVLLPLLGPESSRSFTTDERGEWSLPLADTPRKSGEVVWYQATIEDEAAEQGLALSNALRATIP